MSGFTEPPPDARKVPCRKCGYQLAVESSVCGNCGTRRRASMGGGSLANDRVSSGTLRLLLLIGLVAVGYFFLREPAQQLYEAISDSVVEQGSFSPDDEAGDGRRGRGLAPPGEIEVAQTGGFGGVRDVARALNQGGLRCKPVRVDAEDESVSTGSCQAGGVHVQINVYLYEPSLESVKDSFFGRDFPFAFVYKDNTYVITQTPVARRVRKIIGGRLQLPR